MSETFCIAVVSVSEIVVLLALACRFNKLADLKKSAHYLQGLGVATFD